MQVKEMRGGKKRWLDNFRRDDMKEYKVTEDMAQNRSVWHMKNQNQNFIYLTHIYINAMLNMIIG